MASFSANMEAKYEGDYATIMGKTGETIAGRKELARADFRTINNDDILRRGNGDLFCRIGDWLFSIHRSQHANPDSFSSRRNRVCGGKSGRQSWRTMLAAILILAGIGYAVLVVRR